jgi:predicted small lipoprotein YifL
MRRRLTGLILMAVCTLPVLIACGQKGPLQRPPVVLLTTDTVLAQSNTGPHDPFLLSQ